MPIVEIKDLRAFTGPDGRILGVDHSKNALGLAIATLKPEVITPIPAIKAPKQALAIQALCNKIMEYKIGAAIFGLPLDENGKDTPRSQSVRTFVSHLLKTPDLVLHVAFQDESLSTFEADMLLTQDLQAQGLITDKKKKDLIDSAAACDILQRGLAVLKEN